jgi:two-component system, OmpR family, response regulator VicR
MPRLLLVDDDRFILRTVQKLLSAEGYYCAAVVTAEEARRELSGDPFDLLVLDVGLPDMDGFALCRQIRTKHLMPIILLTARDNSTDKVVGLEVGADDYITKPFDPRELVARVRALLRRAGEYSSPADQPNRISLGEVVLDVDARDAVRDGKPVGLTEREFELLHLLARHRDKALASDWIFENVWGFESEFGLKTLTVYVQRVRRKIEEDSAQPRLLRTVRGFGYKLVSAPDV